MAGQLNENVKIHIRLTGADIATHMVSILTERTITVPIARKIQAALEGLPMTTTRPQLAPTERQVARIISLCEKGRGQTVCYM